MTYGTNQARGCQPVNNVVGTTGNFQTNEYPILSTYGSTMFKGDAVTLSTAGQVIRATASQSVLGIFDGCRYQPTNNTYSVKFPYWPGAPTIVTGSETVALVIDDPNVVFTIQETNASAASGTPLTQAVVGNNADLLYTAGNTTTGLSSVSLNNAATATTLLGQVKVLGRDPQAENPVIGSAFTNWLCTFNNHIFKAGSTRP